MSDAEFAALAERLAERIGGETYAETHLQHATSYPWHERLADGGFLLEDGIVSPLSIDQAIGAFDDTSRRSLIAIGSNADPVTLQQKLAVLEDPADRSVLGIHGSLSDFEIGHSPHLAVYGALPATIFRSPGRSTNATLLRITSAQLTALSRTEFNYLLARIPAGQFVASIDFPVAGYLYAYISRHGVVTDDAGDPVRMHPDDQRALLDRAARVTIDENADAAELVKRTIESYAWAVREARPRLRTIAQPLDRAEWDLHPGS